MRIIFLLVFLFCIVSAKAQPFLISFAGAGLSTVKVQNLTSGVVVDVPAGDVLLLSTPTGIPEFSNMKKSGLKVYPNPMTDKSTLEILPPVAGNAIISVYDMTGKILTQFKDYLENYTQEFSLSGMKNGLNIINIQGNDYQFSEKLFSNGKSNGTASIVKIGNNIQAIAEKKSIMDSKGVQATVDMVYNTGERLKYTAVSGNNSTVVTDMPTANKTVTFTFTECKDGDNINYPVVVIGTQTWMAENIKTTKYRNGVSIGTTSPYDKDIAGEGTPKYQWAYDGNESSVAIYGRLYTWYAITDSRNVCPTGWNVPTDDDWTTLTTNLGGVSVAGGKLKETSTTHWQSPNMGATNETGFTALPGGYRNYYGAYENVGLSGEWWSSTEIPASYAYGRVMYYYGSNVDRSVLGSKYYGFSVRCIKD